MLFFKKPALRLQTAYFEFSLSLWWITLVIILVPLLIHLGLWQLDRARERKQAQIDLAEVLTQAPVSIDDTRVNDKGQSLLPMVIKGELDWSRQFLLQNQVHNTVSGYEILVPLIYAPGKAILLSRGWLPPSPGKKPDLSPPSNIDRTQKITGIAVIPPPRLAKFQHEILEKSADYKPLNLDPNLADWPVSILEEDFEKLSTLLQLELTPRVLQTQDDLAYGYTRVWKPSARGPAVNYGYAAQWFGMALVLLGAMVRLNLKKNVRH